MKTSLSIGLVLGVLLAAPAFAACNRPSDSGPRLAQTMREINAYRLSAGLPTLSKNSKLSRTAGAHACDMARMGKYTHYGSNGSDLAHRVKSQGYRFRIANENVGKFRPTTSAAHWWYGSAGHRHNIMSPKIKDVGFGVALGADDRLYWVMVGGASR